jgi:biotin carboxyl carrier protein
MSTRYVTSIGDQEAVVEIIERTDDRVTAKLITDDAEEVISFAFSSGSVGAFLANLDSGLSIDGRVLRRDAHTFTVIQGATRVDVKAIDEMETFLGGDAMAGDSGQVSVGMPGRVVKLLVAEGDEVTEGQPVIVVEAMKMENEVKSGQAGTVTKIHVEEGQSVEADALLVTVE